MMINDRYTTLSFLLLSIGEKKTGVEPEIN